MHSLEIKLWRQMSSVYSIFRILDPVNLYQDFSGATGQIHLTL